MWGLGVCGQFLKLLMSFPLQSKIKKMKEKYKDQDEEDRELIMKLLGVRARKRCPHCGVVAWVTGSDHCV